jgi:hypothetical protein
VGFQGKYMPKVFKCAELMGLHDVSLCQPASQLLTI